MRNYIDDFIFRSLDEENIIFLKNVISIIIDIIFPILTFIGGAFFRTFCKLIKRRKLFKLTSLNKNSCEILVPVRYGYLECEKSLDEPHRYVYHTMGVAYNYITFDESYTLFEVERIMKKLYINNEMLLLNPNSKELKSYNNKFCFGGIKSNEYVERIFNREMGGTFHFKQNFYLGCTTESYFREGNEHLQPLKIINDELNGKVLYWGVNKNKVSKYIYEIDYVILIKISNKDFSDNEHGTIHICFGNGSNTPLVAIRCLTNHTNELYKRLHKHKNHYFVIMKCSYNGEVDFSNDSFKDLTEIMFGSP